MNDPFAVLGIADTSDDDAIRLRYLQLVKEFSPEKNPEKFAQIRQAYEQLKDRDTRLRHRLFEPGKHETIEGIIEELQCRNSRRRLPLATLFQMATRG